MMARSVRLLAVAAFPGALLAQNVSEVQVAPPSVTMKVGERSGLLATAFDRVGNVIPTVRFIWSSNNVSVAKVDNDGTVTGVGGGVAIVEARVGPRKGQAAVQVFGAPAAGGPAGAASGQPAAPARAGEATGGDPFAGQVLGAGPAAVLRIEPPTIYLLPSENTRVTPRALREDGTPAAPVAVTWKSLRPDIASVDQNGVIVALSAGQGTVQVTGSTGLTATAPVVVQQSDIAIQEPSPVALGPNEVDTLRVVVPAQGGRVVSPLTMQWSSADANVARVSLTGAVIGPATGVSFASDNTQVAAVAEDGTVTAAGYGHARITAAAPGGKRAAVGVFVQGEIVLASSRSGRFQLYAAERSNLAQLRKVTEDTTAATEPAFSPDGSRLAFVSTRHGQPEIYIMDADGTDAARLTNSPAADGGPAFTADGQSVVFHSNRTGHRQVFVQPITSSDAIQLTQEPADNWQPTVSPDGETIAFVSNRDGNDDIWLMSKDGSNQRNFTKSPQVKEKSPHFLRDGSLAFLLEGKESGRTVTQVVKADLATGRMTPLSATDLVITDFAIAPGGDLLALVVNVQKNVSKVFIQPAGQSGGGAGGAGGAAGGAPVAVPTTGPEQVVSATFLP